MGTTTHSPPEVTVALQGTLDTFALPDVLRLLAATKKTGRLRITGGRGTGSVWVSVRRGRRPSRPPTPRTPPRRSTRSSSCSASRTAPSPSTPRPPTTNPAPPTDVELAARRRPRRSSTSGARSRPSCRRWTPGSRSDATLPQPEVAVDQARWTTLVAVGGGATVRRIGDELCLAELPDLASREGARRSSGSSRSPTPPPAGALPSTNGHRPAGPRALVAAEARTAGARGPRRPRRRRRPGPPRRRRPPRGAGASPRRSCPSTCPVRVRRRRTTSRPATTSPPRSTTWRPPSRAWPTGRTAQHGRRGRRGAGQAARHPVAPGRQRHPRRRRGDHRRGARRRPRRGRRRGPAAEPGPAPQVPVLGQELTPGSTRAGVRPRPCSDHADLLPPPRRVPRGPPGAVARRAR